MSQEVYLRHKDRLKGYAKVPKLDWVLHKYLLSDSEYIFYTCIRDIVVDFDYRHRYFGHFTYDPKQIAYYLGWNELKVRRTFTKLNRLGFFRLVYKDQKLYLLTGYGLYARLLEKESLKENYFLYMDRFCTELLQNLDRIGQKPSQKLTEFVQSVEDFIANKDFSPAIFSNSFSHSYGSGYNKGNTEKIHKEDDETRPFSVGRDGMIYDQDISPEEISF